MVEICCTSYRNNYRDIISIALQTCHKLFQSFLLTFDRLIIQRKKLIVLIFQLESYVWMLCAKQVLRTEHWLSPGVLANNVCPLSDSPPPGFALDPKSSFTQGRIPFLEQSTCKH
jgi:hypothetical protein